MGRLYGGDEHQIRVSGKGRSLKEVAAGEIITERKKNYQLG